MIRNLACSAALLLAFASNAFSQLRDATPEERALDTAAFAKVEQALAERLTDVQSVVVAMKGRVLYTYYRDGDPDKLRDVQSVEKSAMAALVGVALARGDLRGLDEPVVTLVPEWAGGYAQGFAEMAEVTAALAAQVAPEPIVPVLVFASRLLQGCSSHPTAKALLTTGIHSVQ